MGGGKTRLRGTFLLTKAASNNDPFVDRRVLEVTAMDLESDLRALDEVSVP
jgi:hypothetical protein